MRKTTTRRSPPIATMGACFLAGALTGWWLHASGPPMPVGKPEGPPPSVGAPSPTPSVRDDSANAQVSSDSAEVERRVIPSTGRADVARTLEPDEAIDELRDRDLRLPLDDVKAESLKGGFEERRNGSTGHRHEAADILAPRNTPVRAVDDGTIVRLFFSKAGGRTIYQFDPTSRFCYYYAHLERYAIGVHEGQRVKRGDVIGYVGTSGNAPKGTPHLHFAVFVLGPERNWWQGMPLDPYLVFKK